MRKPPKVLFIMGTGRSGTTILEVVLANSADVFGVGEVTHVFRDGLIRDEVCSCGEKARRCEFWSSLFRLLGWTEKTAADLDIVFRRIESHSRFFLTWLGFQKDGLLKRYRSENLSLYSRVSELAGAKTIVDSSKYAGRAWALLQAMKDDVAVIWLVRSPDGVLSAFSKPNKEEQRPKRPLVAMMYYLYVMTCAWLVKRRFNDQVLMARYDAFVASPDETLARIEKWSGLDLTVSRRKISEGAILDIRHILTGNRLRKQRDLRFRVGSSEYHLETVEARICRSVMNAWARLLKVG